MLGTAQFHNYNMIRDSGREKKGKNGSNINLSPSEMTAIPLYPFQDCCNLCVSYLSVL